MEDEAKNVIIEESSSWDAEKQSFQRRIKELETERKEMNWKRLEDLKAGERVFAIIASKEKAWKCEKIQLVKQIEFQRFNINEDIHIKDESVPETSKKVINHSRYVAELKHQKDEAQRMLGNSLAEMEGWKLKTQEKKHVDSALRRVTEEMMRLQKEIEVQDAFILSQISKKDTVGFRDSVQAELRAKEMELSSAENRPTDGVGRREREAEKWKRLYLGLKLDLDNLQISSANAVREEENHPGGKNRRSSTMNTGRILDASLDRKHWEEMLCFKLERKSEDKQIEGLRKQLKTSKGEKEVNCQGRTLSIC